jgi:hypothetical protein
MMRKYNAAAEPIAARTPAITSHYPHKHLQKQEK